MNLIYRRFILWCAEGAFRNDSSDTVHLLDSRCTMYNYCAVLRNRLWLIDGWVGGSFHFRYDVQEVLFAMKAWCSKWYAGGSFYSLMTCRWWLWQWQKGHCTSTVKYLKYDIWYSMKLQIIASVCAIFHNCPRMFYLSLLTFGIHWSFMWCITQNWDVLPQFVQYLTHVQECSIPAFWHLVFTEASCDV